MKIGELSRLGGCSIQTIRYYEKEGLLNSAARSEGNFRLFDQSAVDRLSFIKRCRSLDISLSEIKQLLKISNTPASACGTVNQMVERHIVHIEEQITELKNLHAQLRQVRNSCSENRTVRECGIIQHLGNH